nr:hypothetical protein [Pedobacter sp. ASV19]
MNRYYNCDNVTNPGGGQDPGTGTGGGDNNTNPDIRNKTTDPCISKTVGAALKANKNIEGIMAQIINNFDQNKSVTINVYDGQTAHGTPGQTTNMNTINGTLVSADITLLTSYFQDSSKESLAAVLIHEFLHAYIKQVGSGILNSPHNEIAAKYIDPMAAYLKQAYNLSSTDAYALAWSGVSDSKAFQEATADTIFSMADGNVLTKSDISNLSAQFNGGIKGTPICN